MQFTLHLTARKVPLNSNQSESSSDTYLYMSQGSTYGTVRDVNGKFGSICHVPTMANLFQLKQNLFDHIEQTRSTTEQSGVKLCDYSGLG